MKTTHQTLLQIAGVRSEPSTWQNSVLVIVDAQEFYRTGLLGLAGMDAAINAARSVLDAARGNGAPVIHVVQKSKPGSEIFSEQGCRILA